MHNYLHLPAICSYNQYTLLELSKEECFSWCVEEHTE